MYIFWEYACVFRSFAFTPTSCFRSKYCRMKPAFLYYLHRSRKTRQYKLMKKKFHGKIWLLLLSLSWATTFDIPWFDHLSIRAFWMNRVYKIDFGSHSKGRQYNATVGALFVQMMAHARYHVRRKKVARKWLIKWDSKWEKKMFRFEWTRETNSHQKFNQLKLMHFHQMVFYRQMVSVDWWQCYLW